MKPETKQNETVHPPPPKKKTPERTIVNFLQLTILFLY